MIKQLIPFNILNYLLKLNLSIDRKELRGLAKVTISNRGNYPLSKVTFLLNQGLKPTEVSSKVVSSWRVFRASLSDLSGFIVNAVEVSFSKSLGVGSTTELVMSYEGSIKDYSNMFLYVKDHIGDYTLLG